MKRAGRTDVEMLASGQWTRDGRKQYRHASGVRIVYRHNDYLWEIIGGAKDGDCYEPLWVARYKVERAS